MKKTALLLLLFTTLSWSQTYKEEGINISTKEGITSEINVDTTSLSSVSDCKLCSDPFDERGQA